MRDVRERITELGAEPVGGTAEAFGAFIRAETERWGRLIRSGKETK
jgi:tripartite-type tricarboxylate transporter receptor subunit TctC